jgi:hypothetical protein
MTALLDQCDPVGCESNFDGFGMRHRTRHERGIGLFWVGAGKRRVDGHAGSGGIDRTGRHIGRRAIGISSDGH